MAAYLKENFEEALNDADIISGQQRYCMGSFCAGIFSEIIYKAISGNRITNFDTILKVIGSRGVKPHAEAAGAKNE